MAYTIHDQPGHELVLRAGAGLFYETIAINNFFGDGVALGAARTVSYKSNPFPLTQSLINLPMLPPAAPYTFIGYPDTSIVPPYALQWNASLEQALGSKQPITLGYVASGGRKLTTFKLYSLSGLTGGKFTDFQLYANGPGSSYNSLQLKYQRQLFHGLQALASYTWSHSIDWSSSDNTQRHFLFSRENSDTDVRVSAAYAAVPPRTNETPGASSNPNANKFAEDGSARPFAGNTIICPLPKGSKDVEVTVEGDLVANLGLVVVDPDVGCVGQDFALEVNLHILM